MPNTPRPLKTKAKNIPPQIARFPALIFISLPLSKIPETISTATIPVPLNPNPAIFCVIISPEITLVQKTISTPILIKLLIFTSLALFTKYEIY